MSTNDNRTGGNREEALEWAEASDDSGNLAVVHALVYVGDMIADLGLVLANQAGAVIPPPSPKLRALLTKPTPFTEPVPEQVSEEVVEPDEDGPLVMPNGRVYKPAHDPRLWEMDPITGDWISPGKRRFSPKSKQVLGVIRRLEQMRKAGTLYTKPIQQLEPPTA